jgi:CheY-like chemotaxis protein
MRISRPILLVNDDAADAAAVQRALQELGVSNPLVHLRNNRDALEYLRDGHTKPCIILLDTPGVGIAEFLRQVKADESLNWIPVVVLTASEGDEDVEKSFELGAVGYMVKSGDYSRFLETVKAIHSYWSLSELPCKD